jgi:hypothetical protein
MEGTPEIGCSAELGGKIGVTLGAGNLKLGGEALTQHLKRCAFFSFREFGGPARAATGQNSIVVKDGCPALLR